MNTKTTNNTLMKGKGEAVNADLLVIPPPDSLLNMDCMELMKLLPDDYIDLAIVDPPYGIGKRILGTWGKKTGMNQAIRWDYAPGADYFAELFRVSKNQIIWGGNYFLDYLGQTDGFIIWDKMNGTNPMTDAELAWTSYKKYNKIFRMHHFSEGYDKKIHPTQKPAKLYRWILKNYAEPGNKILDTHVGSGSSLVACKELGYNYWGTEIDKEYYEGAKARIEKAFRQYKLL